MKYEVRFTGQFKKDLKLAQMQGKNTDKLFDVIEKLVNGKVLEERYKKEIRTIISLVIMQVAESVT